MKVINLPSFHKIISILSHFKEICTCPLSWEIVFLCKKKKQTSNYLSKKHIFQPAIFTTKRKQNKPTSVAVLFLSRVRVSLSLAFNHTYSHTSIWSDS